MSKYLWNSNLSQETNNPEIISMNPKKQNYIQPWYRALNGSSCDSDDRKVSGLFTIYLPSTPLDEFDQINWKNSVFLLD